MGRLDCRRLFGRRTWDSSRPACNMSVCCASNAQHQQKGLSFIASLHAQTHIRTSNSMADLLFSCFRNGWMMMMWSMMYDGQVHAVSCNLLTTTTPRDSYFKHPPGLHKRQAGKLVLRHHHVTDICQQQERERESLFNIYG